MLRLRVSSRQALGPWTVPRSTNAHFAIHQLIPTASRPASSVCLPKLMVMRWNHNRGAKMGNHLKTLNELSYEKSRNEAVEKRKKKKDKKQQTRPKDSDTVHNEHFLEDVDRAALPDPTVVKEKMLQQYQRFQEFLKGMRGGELTPELLEMITVDAYGSPSPLSSVAQVVILSPTVASANCYDPTLVKAVITAIRDKLEVNPYQDEDGSVRIPIPRPSLESRQRLASQVHQRAEACRQQVRSIRRSSMDVIKQGMAGKIDGVSKDDAFRASQELEKVTEDVIQKITNGEKDKQASIFQV